MSAGAIVVVIAGTVIWWVEWGSSPVVTPKVASTVAVPTTTATASAALPQSGASPPPTSSAIPPTTPSVDAVAWSLLKETSDDAALKRFIEQYPDSSFRSDAELRVAALVAERVAKAEAAAKAQAEAAKLSAATQQSSNQASDSPRRPDVEQSTGQSLDRPALIQAIKMELTRVGCYAGKLDGDWTSPAVKESIMKFIKAASLPRAPDDPSAEFLGAIRGQPSRVCPLECARSEIESNGRCVAKTCPNGQKLDSEGDCYTVKQRSASRPSTPETPPKAKSTSRPSAPETPSKAKSTAPAGTVAAGAVGIGCGRFGCKEYPVVNAPAGLPCKHAWQGRRGGWNCSD
jgi:hypothetical protein